MPSPMTLKRLRKRIEMIAPQFEPQARWGCVIIDDPDPDARIAEHQQATGGAPTIYRIIVDPDPARTQPARRSWRLPLHLAPTERAQAFSNGPSGPSGPRHGPSSAP